MKFPSFKTFIRATAIAILSFPTISNATLYEFTNNGGGLIFTTTYTYDDVTGDFLTPGFTDNGSPAFGLLINGTLVGGIVNMFTLVPNTTPTTVQGFAGFGPGPLLGQATLVSLNTATLTHTWDTIIFPVSEPSDVLISGITTFSGRAVAAVPEPETYAMFLVGLGLLGFISRRKQA